ncbi:MAG TPA: SIMPL domain-containing protein [Pyrinomonadaceae bacterium]|nr:SIMPL domain-containing protein [Pyrinomonadaceae bacterium]
MNNLKSRSLFLVLATLILGSGAMAQDRPLPPLITVSGQAEVLVIPDEVVFNLKVVSLEKELPAAQAKNDRTVKSLLELAHQYEIPANHIQTSSITLDQRYSDEDVTKKPSVFLGYTVTKKVVMILRDVSTADALLADIFKAGVSQIEDVDFRTTQIRKYKDQARALAMKAAQEKAVALTKEIGQNIGKAYSIVEEGVNNGYLSNNFMANSQGRNASVGVGGSYSDEESTIALGQISITARVVVSFELK